MDDTEIILSCFHKTAYKNVKNKSEYECATCTTKTTNLSEWLKTPGNQVVLKQIEFDLELKKFEKLKKEVDNYAIDPDFHALMSLEKCMNELDLRREKVLAEFTKKLNEHHDELRNKIQQQFSYKRTKFDENLKLIEQFETKFSIDHLKDVKDLQHKIDQMQSLISNLKQKSDLMNFTILDLTNERLKLSAKEFHFDMNEIFGRLVDKYSLDDYKFTQTLRGHSASVTSLDLVTQNQILSASNDRNIKLWDKSRCIYTYEGHTSSVNCVCKLNHTKFVSGSCDYTLKVWDVHTRECLRTLRGHTGSVLCLKRLKNGYLISGSFDMRIKKWNIENGECQTTFTGHQSPVRCLSESLDQKIISGSEDRTIKIWDQNGVCLKTLIGHQNWVFCLLVINETFLASGSEDKTIKIWNMETGYCIKVLQDTSRVTSLTKYKHIISGSLDGTIKFWDLNTGSSLKTLKVTDFSVNSICVNQDGDIFCASSDKNIKILSTN